MELQLPGHSSKIEELENVRLSTKEHCGDLEDVVDKSSKEVSSLEKMIQLNISAFKASIEQKDEQLEDMKEECETSIEERAIMETLFNEEIFQLTRKCAELKQFEKELEDAHERNKKKNLDHVS